jgi:hypothetical protein
VLSTAYRRVAVVVASSALPMRHPRPLDVAALRRCDALIFAGLSSSLSLPTSQASPATSTPTTTPTSGGSGTAARASVATPPPSSVVARLSRKIESVLRVGGSAVVPLFASGILYDLLDYVCARLSSPASHLGDAPVYVIGGDAHASLQSATIFSEWFCQARRAQVQAASPPFQHQSHITADRIRVFASVNDAAFKAVYDP